MIINSVGSTKLTIGDTKEYKTTIDVENLDFIASLLSSNLYSDPEASFIREIVSNGWDSHVEAGNTNTPILVKVSKNNNSYYAYDITIRDYGTGLSKEAFENIYCKIGTSTKRLSNNYLGCFGIGKFSTMAVSKVAYITSYYNGVARFYIMTKDGNEITTNLMSENPTTEHNGLEVTVKNVYNIDRYKKAIDALLFFPNVYIDGITSKVNNTKIKKFKYFSACTEDVRDKILLGNVLYPLNTNAVPTELLPLYRYIERSGIVFNFNIGELSVTPNRESIIYNTKTNALIAERIRQAIDEMKECMKKVIKLDCDDPYKYYSLLNRSFGFDFVHNKDYYDYSTPFYVPSFRIKDLDFDISLNGTKDVSEIVLMWLSHNNPHRKAYVTSSKVYKDKYPYSVNKDSNSPKSKIIFVNPNLKFTSVLKSYLIDNYPDTVIVSNCTFDDFKIVFHDDYKNIDINDPKVLNTLRICYKHYMKRGNYIDFDNCQAFLNYKEKIKKEAKENKVPTLKEIILYVQHPGQIESKRYFRKYDDAIKYIKSLNKGIFFRKLDETYDASVANRLGYISISANQSVLKALDQEKFTARVNKDALYNNKKMTFVKSVQSSELFNISMQHLLHNGFLSTLTSDQQKLIYEAQKATPFLHIKLETQPDNSVVEQLNTIVSCFNKYVNLLNELDCNGDSNIKDLIAYIIMKNKMYKISSTCYKRIKSNKIILKLCKK